MDGRQIGMSPLVKSTVVNAAFHNHTLDGTTKSSMNDANSTSSVLLKTWILFPRKLALEWSFLIECVIVQSDYTGFDLLFVTTRGQLQWPFRLRSTRAMEKFKFWWLKRPWPLIATNVLCVLNGIFISARLVSNMSFMLRACN